MSVVKSWGWDVPFPLLRIARDNPEFGDERKN